MTNRCQEQAISIEALPLGDRVDIERKCGCGLSVRRYDSGSLDRVLAAFEDLWTRLHTCDTALGHSDAD